MASIYQRGRIYWVAFTLANGERVQRSTGCTTRRAADVRARAIIAEAELAEAEGRAGIVRREPLSVTDALDQWLAAVDAPASGYAARYRRQLRRIADREIRPRFGALDVLEVTRPRILTWRDDLSAGRRRPSTVNRIMAALRSFLTWLVGRGLLPADPAARLGQLKERPQRRHRALTPDVLERWFQELVTGAPGYGRHDPGRGLEHCRWIRFLCESGLRQAEGQRLTRAMVDLDRRVIYLPADLCKGAVARTVPLTELALVALRGQGIDDLAGDDLVFGATCRRGALAGAWTRAGLTGRIPTDHDFRHTAASIWIRAGTSLVELQAILGHVSSQTTARYIHDYGDRSADLAARIDAARASGTLDVRTDATLGATVDDSGSETDDAD